MNKRISIILALLVFIYAVPAIAADLSLRCDLNAFTGEQINCDLSFSSPEDLITLQGNLNIPTLLRNAVAFSNLPVNQENNEFKAEYNSNTNVLIISDDTNVYGASSVTRVATLSFIAQSAGTDKVTLTITEILDQDFGPIVLGSTTVESNPITITEPSYSCTGTTPTNAQLCSGDDQGLTVDTPKTVAITCGAPKCEYTCNAGYEKSGNSCVQEQICTDDCTPGTFGCIDRNNEWTCVQEADTCYDQVPSGCAIGEVCLDDDGYCLPETIGARLDYQIEQQNQDPTTKQSDLSFISLIANILRDWFIN